MSLLLVAIAVVLQVQDADAKAAIAEATAEEASQWVMNYYRKPDPQRVPAWVRRMSELKLLEKRPHPQAFEMFFGQVMRANPKLITAWMSELRDLPEAERKILRQAVWISQTEEGKEWLAANGEKELAEKPGHPLTTGEGYAMEAYHLDMMWEWFFATGQRAPVEKIVGAMNMLPVEPGEERRPPPPPPGVDRATALRYAIGGAAVWSASSLATSHDKLFEILQEIEKDPRLPARGGAWLKRVLRTAKEDRAKQADVAS